MLQNGHIYFKKSCRFNICYQTQDHLLQDFENVSNHFGILGIEG